MSLDDTIARDCLFTKNWAARHRGFVQQGTRADGQIELACRDGRVKLWTNQIHGEATIHLDIVHNSGGQARKLLRFTGRRGHRAHEIREAKHGIDEAIRTLGGSGAAK